MKILCIDGPKGDMYWDGYGFTTNPIEAIPWSLVEYHKEHIDKMKKADEKAGLDPQNSYVCEFTGYRIISKTKAEIYEERK